MNFRKPERGEFQRKVNEKREDGEWRRKHGCGPRWNAHRVQLTFCALISGPCGFIGLSLARWPSSTSIFTILSVKPVRCGSSPCMFVTNVIKIDRLGGELRECSGSCISMISKYVFVVSSKCERHKWIACAQKMTILVFICADTYVKQWLTLIAT